MSPSGDTSVPPGVAIGTTVVLALAMIVAAFILRGPSDDGVAGDTTQTNPGDVPSDGSGESASPSGGNTFDLVYRDREFTLDDFATDYQRAAVADLDAAQGQDLGFEILWDEWTAAVDEYGPTPQSPDIALGGTLLQAVRYMGITSEAQAPGPDDAAMCRRIADPEATEWDEPSTATQDLTVTTMKEGDVVCVMTTTNAIARLTVLRLTVREDDMLSRVTFSATLWN